MQFFKRSFSLILAAAAAVLVTSAASRADNTAPAITAFNQMFAGVNDYSCTIHAHEVKGTDTQTREYQYWFMKPHFAKTLIVSGDGAGSGGVWAGGDQVSGHQGGILSGIHLKVSINDPRATSLRGVTIPEGLLQNIVNGYGKMPGTLTQGAGGAINGTPTDRLDLKLSDPSTYGGVTEAVLYLSQQTHWPVRQILYQGSQIVLDESVTDLKANTGLTQNDFPF
jgi:hypothetical protein